jgi:hypothetical protein
MALPRCDAFYWRRASPLMLIKKTNEAAAIVFGA